MPEGPECYRLAVKLRKALVGKRLERVEVVGGRYKNHGPPNGLDTLNETLKKQQIHFTDVAAKGKLIYMCLENDLYLISTLGLMGKWVTRGSKHQCMKLNYKVQDSASSNKPKSIYFVDQLHYGTFSIIFNKGEFAKKLATIGPSVLEPNELTKERFIAICRKHNKKAMPEFLMNQKWISGIGNYLKAEVMYDACCSIASPIEDYSDSQLSRVYDSCIRIAHESTFGKYRLKVYRKRKDPHGNPVYCVKTPDKRTTHWVPNVMPIDIKIGLPASAAVADQELVETSEVASTAECLSDETNADDLYSISSFEG